MESEKEKLTYKLVCENRTLPIHSRKAARNYFRSHLYEFTGETILVHPDGTGERMVADTSGLNLQHER
jgi:hypothetical protein